MTTETLTFRTEVLDYYPEGELYYVSAAWHATNPSLTKEDNTSEIITFLQLPYILGEGMTHEQAYQVALDDYEPNARIELVNASNAFADLNQTGITYE